jgi:glucans biosynthesis protein C
MVPLLDEQRPKRLYFLDAVRFLTVLMVVVNHSTREFRRLPRIPFAEWGQEQIISMIFIFSNVFIMQALMFVAGYVAWISLRNRGAGAFMLARTRRIGIPWLIGILFIIPPWHYLMFAFGMGRFGLRQGNTFRDQWMSQFLGLIGLRGGDNPWYYREFNQRHFWFLSLLFFFCAVLAVVYVIVRRIRTDRLVTPVKPASQQSMSYMFLITACTTAAGYFLINYILQSTTQRMYWSVNLLHVVQITPALGFQELWYFCLGIYAASKNWFVDDVLPGQLTMWSAIGVVCLPVFIYSSITLGYRGPFPIPLMVVDAIARGFLGAAIIVLMLAFAHRWLNRDTRLQRICTDNSYIVFIIHNPFIQMFAMPLLGSAFSPLLRFSAIILITVVCSVAISEWIIRRHPRVSVALLILLNAILFVLD